MTTDAKWLVRVEAWRASGLTARSFCEDKEYTANGLWYWSSRERRGLLKPAPMVQVEAAKEAPLSEMRIVKVARAPMAVTETPIVIETGTMRVSVLRGFDRDTLQQVLDVLGSAR